MIWLLILNREIWAFLIVRVRFEIDNVDPVPFLLPTAYRDCTGNKKARTCYPLVLWLEVYSQLTWEHIRKWWPRGPVLQGRFVISFCSIVHYLPPHFLPFLAPSFSIAKTSNNFSGQYTVEKMFEELRTSFSGSGNAFDLLQDFGGKATTK